jgi:GT2 family glycosyltransferase/lipopolysaccharide/colanic/teichoic acid biosynthesis glycosyltransferase
MIDISIVIVNYNVKEYVSHLLQSLFQAAAKLKIEIVVVDNASSDGSVAYLQQQFGQKIKLIANTENLGFARANNMGFKEASGKYTLIINPDTLVKEDTLHKLYRFLEDHPDITAAGCKLLNADGSFAVDSRHSIPSISSAFWKVVGLSAIFPRSKVFADYNVTWMDENETARVPAISGAFMFVRTATLKQLEGFDERFFMYCEDIDLCHRINAQGGKIFYYPETEVIHYKGESTKKDSIDYYILFHRSLYKFFEKYYGHMYSEPFRWFVGVGIFFRGAVNYFKRLIVNALVPIIDLVFLNVSLFLMFFARFSYKFGIDQFGYESGFYLVHLLLSAYYLFFARLNNMFKARKLDLSAMFYSQVLAFIALAATVFFVKELAYSRLVVFLTFFSGLIALIGWRLVAARSQHSRLGKFFRPRVLIAGVLEETHETVFRLLRQPGSSLNIVGLVSHNDKIFDDNFADVPVVGPLKEIPELIRITKAEIVIFLNRNLPFTTLIDSISRASQMGAICKVVPDNIEVLIGKNYIEHLEDLPFSEYNLAYWQTRNQFAKRALDFAFAAVLGLLLLPLIPLIYLINRKKINFVNAFYNRNAKVTIPVFKERRRNPLANLLIKLPYVFSGRMSLVGRSEKSAADINPIKVGIAPVSLLIGSGNEISDRTEIEELYLQKYSILLDIRIFLKYIFHHSKI